MTRKPIVHGTYGGAQQHRLRGIPLCEECREARNAYQRRRRQRDLTAYNKDREQVAAYTRAMQALRERHRAEFDALYEEQKSA